MGLSKRKGHRIIALRMTELEPQRPHFIDEDTGPERTVICPKQNRISGPSEGQASLPKEPRAWPCSQAELGLGAGSIVNYEGR